MGTFNQILLDSHVSMQANHMIDVNVKGVFNTCIPAMARMKSRGKGQVMLRSQMKISLHFSFVIQNHSLNCIAGCAL